MDVDSYIAQYRPEWERLESACAGGARGLTRLTGPQIADVVSLYQRVSGHLAEVQTRFHDPALESYLNRIVIQASGALYASRARTLRDMLRFFGRRYRVAIRATVPFAAAAALLLLGSLIATMLWVASSPAAEAALVPSVAREALREVAREGGGAGGGLSSAGLTTVILVNNVQVSLIAFSLGIGFGIGTVAVLLSNGVFIGTIAGGFHAAGHGGRFWALVLPHGFLELTAICIAAGAGLRMGWALVDPGDRARGRALVEEARDAIVVVVGVAPAFGIAAFYEGYLTGSSLPAALEIGIGGATALAYLWLLLGPVRAARTP